MRRKAFSFENPFTHAKVKLGMSDEHFTERVAELFGKIQKLAEGAARGLEFRPVRVKATKVKAHRRKAHVVMRQCKPRG